MGVQLQTVQLSRHPHQHSSLNHRSNLGMKHMYYQPLQEELPQSLLMPLFSYFSKCFVVWSLTASTEVLAGDLVFHLFWTDDFEHERDVFSEDELQFMLLSAFLYRFVSCFYEFYFIKHFGCTIGKKLFGLKVIQCVMISRNDTGIYFAVLPGGGVSNHSALIRSAFKNMSIAFLIPSSITAVFNSYKQTSYDIFSKTIVVRTNTLSTQQRQQQQQQQQPQQ